MDDLLREVRALHEASASTDAVVAPHKSKYAARIMMNDVLALLRPLISDPTLSLSEAEAQWLTEQQGRIEYLNGVNHIEAEETSAGEKMLAKAMLKFKDNAVKVSQHSSSCSIERSTVPARAGWLYRTVASLLNLSAPSLLLLCSWFQYPFDVMDGYNHLGIVWSNRAQHGVSHAFLMQSQQAFLTLKKLRAQAVAQLPQDERAELARRDRIEQEMEAPQEEDETAAATATTATTAPKAEEKEEKSRESPEVVPAATEESKSNDAAPASSAASSITTAAASSSAASSAALAPQSFTLSSSHPGFHLLPSALWQQLEVTHTLTLFFLAQVFGHLKKRDLAALVSAASELSTTVRKEKEHERTERERGNAAERYFLCFFLCVSVLPPLFESSAEAAQGFQPS